MVHLLALAFQNSKLSVAITHVSIISVDRGDILSDQTIVTRGNSIVSVGPAAKAKIPIGAMTVNGRGKFLIPGLIDMDVKLICSQQLPVFLANGVTTVLNQSGKPVIVNWKNQVNRGTLLGPNILTTGPRSMRPKDSAEVLKVVEDQSRAGYDAIYIDPTLNAPTFSSLVTNARKRRMIALGSIPRGTGLTKFLAEKVPVLNSEEFFDSLLVGEQDMRKELRKAAKQTAEAQSPIIPSLIATTHKLRQAQDLKGFLLRTPTQYLAPWQSDAWSLGVNDIHNRFGDKKFHPALMVRLEDERDLIRQFRASKGIALVGTNSNSLGVVPGYSMIEEMGNLEKLGYSRHQVLRAATLDAAIALGQVGRLGSISVGKQADLVLLSGNPLTDLRFIEQRIGVMSRGKWMSKDALSRSLATLPSQYIGLANRGLTAMKIDPDAFSVFQNANDPYNLMTQYLVLELLKTGGSASYAKYIYQMSKKEPNNGLYRENGINNFGYVLMNSRKQIGLAIRVFAVNVQKYPKSANVYDSLAEGYLNLGNKSKAIEFYRKAVKIDPKYPSSLAALQKLGAMK